MERIAYRVRQTLRQIDRRAAPETDSALRLLLDDAEWRLLARMSPADRRHALGIHQELVRRGWTDADLLKAGLLHDIGKADGRVRVALIHRILKVLLSRTSSGLLWRVALQNGGWLRHGLYLSVQHPVLGAKMARGIGLPERVCWLIEHHDDGTITGDSALEALRAIDAEV